MSTRAARPAQPARAPGARRRPRSHASAGLPIIAGPSAILAWNQPYRSNPCVPLPQTGTNPSVAAPATPNWSAWTQITAGEAADLTLIQLSAAATILKSNRIFLQLGVGAAGSETIIYENADRVAISGAGALPLPGFFYRLPPYKLTAGTRLSFRIRQTTATAGDVTIGVVVHAQASPLAGAQPFDGDTYATGSPNSTQLIIPAIPSTITMTSGGAPDAYGAWYEFIAAAATRLRPIAAVSPMLAAGNGTTHLQIGTGAAGLETPHELASFVYDGAFTAAHHAAFARAADIRAGERVALRMRSDTASLSTPTALIYETVPV